MRFEAACEALKASASSISSSAVLLCWQSEHDAAAPPDLSGAVPVRLPLQPAWVGAWDQGIPLEKLLLQDQAGVIAAGLDTDV